MPMKPMANFSHFEALDMRVGRVVRVEDAATRQPTYRITVDFGPEVGTKVSCGAYRRYTKEELLGKLVIAVVNFGPKEMGPETSEVLILGVPNAKDETIYLTTESEVPLGVEVF
jgi:tRNA-binding protein